MDLGNLKNLSDGNGGAGGYAVGCINCIGVSVAVVAGNAANGVAPAYRISGWMCAACPAGAKRPGTGNFQHGADAGL